MTDQERFEAMAGGWGVKWTYSSQIDNEVGLFIEAGEGPKQVGYTGFFTVWVFDLAGAFLRVEISE